MRNAGPLHLGAQFPAVNDHRNPAYIVERVVINGINTIKQALSKTHGKWKNQRVRLSRMALPNCDCLLLHELLCTHPSVVGLELLDCEMRADDLMFILSHMKDYHLTTVQLSKLPLGDEGAKYLAAAIQETNIKSLDLAWNEITKVGARRIADALSDSPLEHLSLAQNNIGDGVTWICLAISSGRTMLKSLDVSRNEIIDHGAVALAEALPQSQLTSVAVKYNRLTPRGIAALCQAAIQTPSLVEIHFSGNQLGNAQCVGSIAHMLKNTKMEVLGIAHSNLTPNELAVLSKGVSECPTLKKLKMGQNQFINEESARQFMYSICTHPGLKEVDMDDCEVSEDFKKWKDQCVRKMTSNTTRTVVMLLAVLTIPRLIASNSHLMMDAYIVRTLAAFLGEEEPPLPLPGPPVYQYLPIEQEAAGAAGARAAAGAAAAGGGNPADYAATGGERAVPESPNGFAVV